MKIYVKMYLLFFTYILFFLNNEIIAQFNIENINDNSDKKLDIDDIKVSVSNNGENSTVLGGAENNMIENHDKSGFNVNFNGDNSKTDIKARNATANVINNGSKSTVMGGISNTMKNNKLKKRQIKADTINTANNSIVNGGIRYDGLFSCGTCIKIKKLKITGKYKNFLITRKIELTIDSNGRIIISGDLDLYDYSLSIEKY